MFWLNAREGAAWPAPRHLVGARHWSIRARIGARSLTSLRSACRLPVGQGPGYRDAWIGSPSPALRGGKGAAPSELQEAQDE